MPNKDTEAPTTFSEEQIVNWLIDECRDTGSRLATVSTSGDRILATGSAVIALAATVALGGDRSHLLMTLPFGVTIAIVYGFYLNNMARALSAYKAVLEEEIARRVGLPVIAWSSRVARNAHVARPTKSLLGLGAVVCVGSAAVGLDRALRTLPPGAWGHELAWLYITATAASIAIGFSAIAYSALGTRGYAAVTQDVAVLLARGPVPVRTA